MAAIAGLEVGLPASLDDVDAPWMTTVLRTSGAIDSTTSVTALDTEPFQVGVGLLGQLARASMRYEGGAGPDTVILKWPIEVPHQRGMADALNAYEREVRFYRELMADSDLRCPTVHAAMIDADKSHSMIVMEDLSHLRQADRVNGVTWDEAVLAVRTLARFQAGWHESDRLDDLASCWYRLDNPVYNAILPQFMAAGWPKCRQYGAEHLDDEIVALGNDWTDLLPAMQRHLVTSPTLSHADWRADNMFIDDAGIIMIDFQLTGVANGAYDLAYFVSQSVEREVRRGREHELVQIYVDELAQHAVDRDPDQVWFDFQVATGFCLIYGVASYAEFELLPGEGQHVIETILRRSTAGITDVGAIAAVRSLTT